MIMQAEIPRILIAGTHSGCGKTTIASGLMAALVARLRLAAGENCSCRNRNLG